MAFFNVAKLLFMTFCIGQEIYLNKEKIVEDIEGLLEELSFEYNKTFNDEGKYDLEHRYTYIQLNWYRRFASILLVIEPYSEAVWVKKIKILILFLLDFCERVKGGSEDNYFKKSFSSQKWLIYILKYFSFSSLKIGLFERRLKDLQMVMFHL